MKLFNKIILLILLILLCLVLIGCKIIDDSIIIEKPQQITMIKFYDSNETNINFTTYTKDNVIFIDYEKYNETEGVTI